jgi:formate-dependent phosphoribosylglycinamide formyltransferase (GAR transformylase)
LKKKRLAIAMHFYAKIIQKEVANMDLCVRIIKKCMVATKHSCDKQQVPSGHMTFQPNELERSAWQPPNISKQ